MVTLRDLHRYQTARSMVQLEDGRVGKIVRVDTTFPGNCTEVSVYTVEARRPVDAASVGEGGPAAESATRQSAAAHAASWGAQGADGEPGGGSEDAAPEDSSPRMESGPGIARVSLDRIVGLAKMSG